MKRGSVDARRSRAWANRHTVYREYGGLDLAPSQLFDSCINFAGGYRQLLVSHISCSFLKHDRIVFDVEIVITQKRDINFLIQSRRRPFSPLGDQWRSPTIAGLSHSVAIPSENLVAGVAKSLCDDRHWPVSRSLIRPSCGFHERNPPPPPGARARGAFSCRYPSVAITTKAEAASAKKKTVARAATECSPKKATMAVSIDEGISAPKTSTMSQCVVCTSVTTRHPRLTS